jgi:hypothetical protein
MALLEMNNTSSHSLVMMTPAMSMFDAIYLSTCHESRRNDSREMAMVLAQCL